LNRSKFEVFLKNYWELFKKLERSNFRMIWKNEFNGDVTSFFDARVLLEIVALQFRGPIFTVGIFLRSWSAPIFWWFKKKNLIYTSLFFYAKVFEEIGALQFFDVLKKETQSRRRFFFRRLRVSFWDKNLGFHWDYDNLKGKVWGKNFWAN